MTDTTATVRDGRDHLAPHAKSWGYKLLGVVRIMIGFYFFWAFIDKLFGLGFATPAERAWIAGGSPTTGFLMGSVEGGNPFAGIWEVLIANPTLPNILFMVGLLAIGVCYILGIGMNVASISGAAMYFFMYLAAFPMTTNPLFDDHLIFAVLMIGLMGIAAGDYLGLGRTWRRVVNNNTFLV